MHKVVVILGGNEGDTKEILKLCTQKITEAGLFIEKHSKVYQSQSWGYKSKYQFLNQVLILNTDLSPTNVLKKLLQIENDLGRKRKKNSVVYTDRPIDIDILFYDGLVIKTEELTIPHPKLEQRKFCLVPLNELIPEFKHPILSKTISELLKVCNDPLKVVAL